MLHTTRYAFKGCTRLAQDAGVSKSAVSRLLNGRSNPSCRLLTVVFKAIEKQLRKEKKIKQALPLRELISLDDSYPTDSICRLIGCTGCFLSQGAFHRQDAFHREQQ
jgi:predicted transcriptional regulator